MNARPNENEQDLKTLEDLDLTRIRLLEMKAGLAARRAEISLALLKTHPMQTYLKYKLEISELATKDQEVQANLSRLKVRRTALNKKLASHDAGSSSTALQPTTPKDLTAALYEVATASFGYLYNDDDNEGEAAGDALEAALHKLDRLRPGWRDKPSSKKRS
jgi:hypothetical protein